MKHLLYSELRSIYETTEQDPHTFCVTIKLRDPVDGQCLKQAVEETMSRYPYFCMRFCKEDDAIYFEDNPAPVPVLHTDEPITLGGAEVNGHLLAFSYWGSRIYVNCWHAMTDGGGIGPLFQTLLYIYCTRYYKVDLQSPYVRLPGSEISPKEWEDPLKTILPAESQGFVQKWNDPALQLSTGVRGFPEHEGVVTALRIPEKEFMRFNFSNDGSPGTVVSLLLARAIDSLRSSGTERPEKDVENGVGQNRGRDLKGDLPRTVPVVIALCVNQRKALRAPFAHQSLVGDVRLVYNRKIKNMPFSRQATCFRGMVALQSDREMVLDEVRDYQSFMRELEALPDHASRHRHCIQKMEEVTECITATVSYVGKSDMGDVERYVEEMNCVPSTALPSSHTPIAVEIAVINGFFLVNFIEYLNNSDYIDAFVRQLIENQIEYEILYQEKARYPKIDLAPF